ncbi:PPE family protein [Mycobacterium marinum]|uniref:PPE family protein n=1 Tax=Mycobacterium marinum TaxID=1781 RepID=UPI00356A4860
MDYEVPPEINSGRMYAGLGSASLMESAAAWQGLSAQLGSAAAAFGAVIEALTGTAWLGPSSVTMALAAAPYVVWMIATAEQCQAAAGAAAAAAAFEAARAGVVPPPVIAENRAQLAALVATNFMGFNTPAIMANEAHYGQMWSQDTATMYGFAGQAAGITGTLIPFTPPLPNSNPIGLAAQAAALGQSGGQAAGQQPMNFASSAGGLPAGLDGETMLSMGPQLVSMVPQALQGLSSPLSQGLGGGGLGQFQSLLSPFMSFMNPGMFGAGGASSAMSAGGPGLTGLSGAASEVEAVAGRAGSMGGLSVPATWTAGATAESASTARAVAPVAASSGGGVSAAAAPAATAGGSGVYGGTPMAAGMHGRGTDSDGTPRYGKPLRVVHRR